jgi:hypothetical protein
LREADSADDLLPMRPSPSFGEDLAERRSEARSGMAARSLTMSSIVLPRARVRSASSPRRESWLAPWLDAQAKDALPVAAFPDPLPSKKRWPDFGRAAYRAEKRGRMTLTGRVVRLFVVSRLLLSGLPLVARGWQEPSDDGWTHGLADLLLRKRISPVRYSAACLLLMDSNTAWLLHAGDHGLAKVALALPRRCFPHPACPRLLACRCVRFASSPSGGGAGLHSARSVVPLSLGDCRAPGFFGNQAHPFPLDSRLPGPVLPSTPSPSGEKVIGCLATGLRRYHLYVGCFFGSNPPGNRYRPRPRCCCLFRQAFLGRCAGPGGGPGRRFTQASPSFLRKAGPVQVGVAQSVAVAALFPSVG